MAVLMVCALCVWIGLMCYLVVLRVRHEFPGGYRRESAPDTVPPDWVRDWLDEWRDV